MWVKAFMEDLVMVPPTKAKTRIWYRENILALEGLTPIAIWLKIFRPGKIRLVGFQHMKQLAHNWWRHQMETFFALLAFCAGNSSVHRWIPRTKACEAELWCFLWSAPEPTLEQTMETPVIWDAIALIMTSLWWHGDMFSCFIHTKIISITNFQRAVTLLNFHWKPTIVIIPNVSSSISPEVVITTTPECTSDDKVGTAHFSVFDDSVSVYQS